MNKNKLPKIISDLDQIIINLKSILNENPAVMTDEEWYLTSMSTKHTSAESSAEYTSAETSAEYTSAETSAEYTSAETSAGVLSEAVRITSTGNGGLATTSPSRNLKVVGNIKASATSSAEYTSAETSSEGFFLKFLRGLVGKIRPSKQ